MTTNPKADFTALVRWCEQELSVLRREVQMLQAGDIRSSSWGPNGELVDATARSLEDARRRAAELEALLHDVKPATFQQQAR